jgi:hypothetical protein
MRTADEITARIKQIESDLHKTPKWKLDQMRTEAAALDWVLRKTTKNAQQQMNP